MKRVLKETITSREGIVLASENRAIGQHQGLEQVKVVLSNGVAHINRTAGDGPRGGMEGGARVGRLEHVPVGVYEIPHPQAVVGTVHHVAPLEPKRTVWVSGWIRAPEVIT